MSEVPLQGRDPRIGLETPNLEDLPGLPLLWRLTSWFDHIHLSSSETLCGERHTACGLLEFIRITSNMYTQHSSRRPCFYSRLPRSQYAKHMKARALAPSLNSRS